MRTLLLTILSIAFLSSPAFAGGDLLESQLGQEDGKDKGSFYQWTNPTSGSVEFTDNVKRIPESFQAAAVKRSFEDVAKNVAITPTSMSAEDYYAAVSRGLERYRAIAATRTPVNPNSLNDCTGPAVVTSQRMQQGDYNRRIYFVTDECGRTSTVSPYAPVVQINR